MKIYQLTKNNYDLTKQLENFRAFQINPNLLENFINNPANLAYMAVIDNKVVGFAWGYCLERFDERPMLYIHSLDVLEEHRNNGYGKQLIKAFLDYAKNNNYYKTFIITEKDNVPANKVYSSFENIFEDEKVVYTFK